MGWWYCWVIIAWMYWMIFGMPRIARRRRAAVKQADYGRIAELERELGIEPLYPEERKRKRLE